jgi:SAM-dependent methyltransferase
MQHAGNAVSSVHRHPIFARVYPYISRGAEKGGAAEHRRALLAGLQGRVIEVGAGHGLNFAYYPAGVAQVVAVEPEPHLRTLAQAAAKRAPVTVDVESGVAEALPAADGEFDAAVASLVLCSVSDQAVALREIARVLRPGGELRFYEHVVSNRPAMARVQRALDATIYPPLAGGCHTSLRSAGRAHSTIRGYQHVLGLFVDFVCDPRYGWVAECEARFGRAPALICHEWNTAAHVSEFEGRPGRRALTGDCARDTRAAILDGGFQIDREERIAFKPGTMAVDATLGALGERESAWLRATPGSSRGFSLAGRLSCNGGPLDEASGSDATLLR